MCYILLEYNFNILSNTVKMFFRMTCYLHIILTILILCLLFKDCMKNYDVESGEINSPPYTSYNSEITHCTYNIKVPVGRRITVEIIKGKTLIQTCENSGLPENKFKEKLRVNINKYFQLYIIHFTYII